MAPALRLTDQFLKALRRLPPDRQKSASAALELFMQQPALLPSLKFRVLRGRADHYIINATRGDRLILRRTEPDRYDIIDVGPHDLYRRWNR